MWTSAANNKPAAPKHEAANMQPSHAAQSLLRQGLASYAEIAALSGRSRQVVWHWAKELGAESARQDHLAKLWRDALRQNKKQIGDTGAIHELLAENEYSPTGVR